MDRTPPPQAVIEDAKRRMRSSSDPQQPPLEPIIPDPTFGSDADDDESKKKQKKINTWLRKLAWRLFCAFMALWAWETIARAREMPQFGWAGFSTFILVPALEFVFEYAGCFAGWLATIAVDVVRILRPFFEKAFESAGYVTCGIVHIPASALVFSKGYVDHFTTGQYDSVWAVIGLVVIVVLAAGAVVYRGRLKQFSLRALARDPRARMVTVLFCVFFVIGTIVAKNPIPWGDYCGLGDVIKARSNSTVLAPASVKDLPIPTLESSSV